MTFQEIRNIAGNDADAAIVTDVALKHTTPHMLCAAIEMECTDLYRAVTHGESGPETESKRARLRFLRGMSKDIRKTYGI